MAAKEICIIGGGMSGIGSITICLEEGLIPVCYECQEDIGGLWRYKEEDDEGRGCVMKSTIINTSKEMSSPSKFIIPGHYPNYMHNTQMLEVIELMSEKVHVRPYISFFHKVLSVVRAEDYEATGEWKVRVRDLKLGKEFEKIFAGVLVGNGHHVYPLMPKFPGIETFKGRIVHSRGFKSFENYKGQNVVVVGAGNSGLDAVVDASLVAKKAYLSLRSGAWIMPRKGPWGLPLDTIYLTRWMNTLYNLLPFNVMCTFAEWIANFHFDHELYNMKPNHRIYEQHAILQDVLPSAIISGSVVVKRNIKTFTPHGVIFEEESEETPIDTVVMATGYKISFPFLAEDVVKTKDNRTQLYKFVFPHDHKHPTMAFIGLFQSIGPGFPAGELQLRWACRVFAGKQKLPPRAHMEVVTKKFFDATYKRFRGTPNHTLHVDYINYIDDLASIIGCKPNMWKLLVTDPKLFYHCFFGPCLPFQFRLMGPGTWDGAREAILTSQERVRMPLGGKKKSNSRYTYISNFILIFVALLFFTLMPYFM